MKKIIAVAAISLLTSGAWAHDKAFGDTEEMYGSVLLDHTPSKPGYKPEMPENGNFDPDPEGYNFLIENQKHTVHKHEKYDPKAFNAFYDDPDGYRDYMPNI